MRKTLLILMAMCPLVAAPALALADNSYDPADRSHVSFEEARNKLERLGYTDIKDIDNKLFDAWVEVLATNPDGKRVHIKLDNTVGTLVHEQPLGY